MVRRVLATVLCILCTASFAAADYPVVPGEFIVKFRPGATPQLQQASRSGLGVDLVRESRSSNRQLVRTSSATNFNATYAKKLLASGLVEYIEPNYIVSVSSTPNDSRFDRLWGLHNTGQDGGTANVDIDAPEAWDISHDSDSVVVGIVDTGVNYDHPDLAANIWTNPGEIPGNNIDDDGNGVVDDVHGMNAINGRGDARDDHSHGTHCAGTIGGTGNNALGVVGVNWKVKIMALKFLNSSGSGTTDNAIKAIEYAIEMKRRGVNIRVLSNSWGGGGYSQALADAIQSANTAGILFVAAAGNDANDNDGNPSYPASYDIPNIVSVAAIDRQGNLASFSNYGSVTVDLAAPGVDIFSTVLGSGYSSYSGTSMATPHVAGVAALVAGREAALSVSQLKDRIIGTVRRLPGLQGIISSSGMVNAYNALTNTRAPMPPIGSRPGYRRVSLAAETPTQLGQRILSVDDGYAAVNLDFAFPYYEQNFDRVAVSANGRIVPLRSDQALPTEADYSNRIAPGLSVYQDDLYPSPFSSDGGVWYKRTSTAAIFTWISVTYANRTSSDPQVEVRFQAKLFSDGQIEFLYHDTYTANSLYDYGASASIGLAPTEEVPGEWLTVSHNHSDPAALGNGKALHFAPGHGVIHSDFDGDGKSDIAAWQPGSGGWTVILSSKNYDSNDSTWYQLGLPGDTPLINDFDGDGRADFAVWRPSNGTWYFRYSRMEYATIVPIQWGMSEDIPLVGDFDGDGASDLTVYRVQLEKVKQEKRKKKQQKKRKRRVPTPRYVSIGSFHTLLSSTGFNRAAALKEKGNAGIIVRLGERGYDPLVADFTGDGKADFVTVWQPARYWSVKNQSDRLLFSFSWGVPGDGVMACDWDGSGVSSPAVVRLEPDLSLSWIIRSRSGTPESYSFGVFGDQVSCTRDYDGDGLADMTAFRAYEGRWYLRLSSTGTVQAVTIGSAGDISA